ncbi:uncharacterized protein LOC6050685 [Culex quinquefasciatus]|uniref:uncharacterized protein LOC6050685 n=1 Tax=Culex quinquefasciatus TaxID=7176 RepID=UPI0018E39368|nr:uncharacterized protein LOC6050685 [Culex quinquefasciatus]
MAQHNFTKRSTHVQTELPFTVIHLEHTPAIQDNPLFQAIELGSTVFVVDEDAALSFLDKFIPFHDYAMFRNPGKCLIITINSVGAEASDLLEKIKLHPTILEIANLLIVVPNGKVFELITHRWVGDPPEALELLHLDTYQPDSGTFVDGNDLFPDKMNNLMGKTIRLAAFYLLPWIMMRQKDDGVVRYLNQSYTIDGIDGYMLVQFCIRFNCTWDLSVDQYWQYGQVFENRTGNGMTGALVARKVDFALAAMGSWFQLFKYFSFSISIQWIGITTLTPKPKYVLNVS